MRDEIQRLKQLQPEMAHKEVFTMAAKNWVRATRLIFVSTCSLAHAPSAPRHVSQECADSNPAGCIIKDYGAGGGESGGGEGSGAAAGADEPGGEGGGDDGSITN